MDADDVTVITSTGPMYANIRPVGSVDYGRRPWSGISQDTLQLPVVPNL